jgi:hypothetical protein
VDRQLLGGSCLSAGRERKVGQRGGYIVIPQNRVVDPQGTWRWTQLGFDGAPDWVDQIIQRLQSVKKMKGHSRSGQGSITLSGEIQARTTRALLP